MNTLKDYVDWKLTHSDKTAEVEGYPLILEKCKVGKQMRELKVWGSDGGVGEKTVNLYDAKTYPSTDGMAVWGTMGGVGIRDGISATGYIPCSELSGKIITCGLGGQNAPGISFYDDNQTYISGKGYTNKSTITITVPENASYLRWCFNTDTKDQAMIVEGDTLPNYEPYGKYKIPIVQRGKNILGNTEFTYSNASLEEINGGVIATGSISDTETANLASKGWVYFTKKNSNPIIKFGQTIVVSADLTALEKRDERFNPEIRVYLRDNEKTITLQKGSAHKLEFGVKKRISHKFEIDSEQLDGKRLSPVFTLNSCVIKIENVQMEYGDVATPYEPYVKPITHNVFIDEQISGNDILDVKEHIQLPKIITKTTIFETDTEVKPKIYGKYIK